MTERKPVYGRRWIIKRLVGVGTAAIASTAIISDLDVSNSKNSSTANTGCESAFLHITEPKDIVPNAELTDKYHTRIWNTPDVSLFLRRSAIDEEPVFKVLSGEKAAAPSSIESLPGLLSSLGSDPRSFDIVLIDGPVVHSSFMTDEQKQGLPWLYKELKTKEKNTYQKAVDSKRKYHESGVEYLEKALKELEDRKANNSIDRSAYETRKNEYEKELSFSKTEMSRLEGDGVKDGVRLEKSILGQFGYKIDISKDSGGTLRYNVLIAVKPDYEGKNYDTDHDSFFARSPLQPLEQWQSYPSESDFRVSSDPTYPVQSNRIGWGLRHEFAHAASSAHPQTDLIALERLIRANKLFCGTGDSSLYYFVFKTPEDLIITKNSNPIKSTSSPLV